MTPTDPRIWRAVANPSRRRLIDLLRDGPRTTGDLCRAFPTSRFAVMKHLGALERAGLIAVRREGRDRWNSLVPGPLRQLEGHWPSAPEAAPPAPPVPPPGSRSPGADQTGGHDGGKPPEPGRPGLATFSIESDLYIDAGPSRVFDALTVNIAAWWGAPHLESDEATNLVVEAQLGGRFYEEWGHRQGVIRGMVTAIRQDERIQLTGAISGASPLPGRLQITLERREGGTLLRFAHSGVAESSAQVDRLRAMWADLLKTRLKDFVERGFRSGIGTAG
jgi:uncharacterized protein YndB with AHSA1/START domain